MSSTFYLPASITGVARGLLEQHARHGFARIARQAARLNIISLGLCFGAWWRGARGHPKQSAIRSHTRRMAGSHMPLPSTTCFRIYQAEDGTFLARAGARHALLCEGCAPPTPRQSLALNARAALPNARTSLRTPLALSQDTPTSDPVCPGPPGRSVRPLWHGSFIP